MNNLDKQYTNLIGDAYKNYINYPLATVHNHRTNILYQNMDKGWCMINGRSIISPHPTRHLTQEEFINKIKTDTEFSEKWGLKIEELELSDKEETYSIPIYENGIKTEWSVDGIVGDEKYKQLTEMSPEGKLPIIINTNTKK